uniref:Secreted protein n=1 Tax=Steinernema glaseri TaxID=37863 RepID=A0A1I7YV51_9BILA
MALCTNHLHHLGFFAAQPPPARSRFCQHSVHRWICPSHGSPPRGSPQAKATRERHRKTIETVRVTECTRQNLRKCRSPRISTHPLLHRQQT